MRLGWTSGNWLFYGSGGVAFGGVSSTEDLLVTWPGNVHHSSGSNSETLGGWAAGAGVNYALTRNWIAGVDYLHYDLGHSSVTGATSCCWETVSQRVGGDIVRGVINYKF
jgi:outer membrane immunogenic protein